MRFLRFLARELIVHGVLFTVAGKRLLIMGDQEIEAGQVNLRMRDGQKPGAMSVDDFVALALKAMEEKRLL